MHIPPSRNGKDRAVATLGVMGVRHPFPLAKFQSANHVKVTLSRQIEKNLEIDTRAVLLSYVTIQNSLWLILLWKNQSANIQK